MNKMQEQVLEFSRKFYCVVHRKPYPVNDGTETLRERLMTEELNELRLSMAEQDMIGIADGLADLLYVVFGTAIAYGIDMEPVVDEVHRSNMSKVFPDGKVRRDPYGKILKPETFSRPDIQAVLEAQQWEP
jgi:predicted HAD superfamily Cof-like phosphohydrolase